MDIQWDVQCVYLSIQLGGQLEQIFNNKEKIVTFATVYLSIRNSNARSIAAIFKFDSFAFQQKAEHVQAAQIEEQFLNAYEVDSLVDAERLQILEVVQKFGFESGFRMIFYFQAAQKWTEHVQVFVERLIERVADVQLS